jgi:hypothetical protein
MRYHILRRASGTTTQPSSSLADWQQRISGPGVVWFHDFESEAEVDAFRWDFGTGNDPNDQSVPNRCRYRSDDGITHGCLEQFRPAGNIEPPEWWRPFSPLTSPGNGRSSNDPAASGTLTVQTYNSTQGGSQIQNWGDRGYYGHPDYHAADPGAFDGTDYYVQCRVKTSASRVDEPDGGKLFYFTRTDMANTSQEIVVISNNVVSQLNPNANLLKLYRSGSPGLDEDDPGSARQPGNTMGVCQTSPTIVNSGCYFTPQEEWYTYLFHITPGHDSGNDTRVEVWVAHWGETSYTKVWDQSNVDLPFAAGHPFGHNALICAGWMNSIVFSQDVYHRYCQIIFSKQSIACPQVYEEPIAPTLLSNTAAALSPGGSSTVLNGSGLGASAGQNPGDARQTIQWGNRFFYDHVRGILVMCGKDALSGSGTGERSTSIYTASADSWATSGRFHIAGAETGHMYESFAYDPAEGTAYVQQWGTEHFERWTFGSPLASGWTPTANDPLGHWAQDAAPVNKAVAWHPNLFGTGDGGLVFLCNIDQSPTMVVRCWRKLTNTYHTVSGTEHDSSSDTNSGSCVYVRSGDYVIATFGFGNTYRVNAGSGGSLAAGLQITNPPIICTYTNSGARGMLFDDPTGIGGPYILEKCGTNRVWRYISNAWSLRGYTHPLPGGSPTADASWYVASCYPLGVFVSYRRSGDPALRIWKPND